jgi:diaminopimelate epimerase
MIIEIPFTKASGAGNDFVIVDNRDKFLPADLSTFARRICSRHFGVGADGLLILDNSSSAHFKMHYYNSDGSYGGMCGNGGRCLARYAFTNGITPRKMSFESLDFIYRAEVIDDLVSLSMKDPLGLRPLPTHPWGATISRAFYIDTGSPHVVAFVAGVKDIAVASLGSRIRHDPLFAPSGTNVNFVEVMSNNSLRLRTYERGVEAETLACGTGTVAAGIVANQYFGTRFPVKVRVESGECLTVRATVVSGQVRFPELEGSAHILFSGKLLYDVKSNSIAGLTERVERGDR